MERAATGNRTRTAGVLLAAALSASTLVAAAFAVPAQAGRLADASSPYLLERDGDAARWWPWGAEALAEAQRRKRPVFVLVGTSRAADCAAPERALLADAAVTQVLERRFVSVAVDADERPDVADLYATAPVALGQEPPGDGPLWAVLTPEGWPYAAGAVLDDTAFRAAFAARLERLAADLDERTGDVRTQAGAALAALRQAQSSEDALRPLDAATAARAVKGLHDAFDPRTGRFAGALAAPLRLLLARAEAGDDDARRLLRRVLDVLEKQDLPRCAPTLAEHAERLRTFALAYALTGELRYRAAAERLAAAAAERKDDTGAFTAGPGDARVVAAWNGLMIGALAASGKALARPADVTLARGAADAVLARLGPAGALRRVAGRQGAHGMAQLADYAALAEGLLELAAATSSTSRDAPPVREARALVEAALGRFADPRGGFFDSEAAHEPLPARPRNGYDGARLSGNGLMAGTLLRLAAAGGEARYEALARDTLAAFTGDLQRAPRGLETLAAVSSTLHAVEEEGDGAPPAGPAGAGTAPGGFPAEAIRGPVTVTLTLPERTRRGERVEAQVTLDVVPGFTVNAHRPRSRDLVGLTVALPTRGLRAEEPHYPVPSDVRRRFEPEPAPAYVGTVHVVLPFVVPRDAAPGPQRVRVRVGFQACGVRACQAPDSVVLETPLEVAP